MILKKDHFQEWCTKINTLQSLITTSKPQQLDCEDQIRSPTVPEAQRKSMFQTSKIGSNKLWQLNKVMVRHEDKAQSLNIQTETRLPKTTQPVQISSRLNEHFDTDLKLKQIVKQLRPKETIKSVTSPQSQQRRRPRPNLNQFSCQGHINNINLNDKQDQQTNISHRLSYSEMDEHTESELDLDFVPSVAKIVMKKPKNTAVVKPKQQLEPLVSAHKITKQTNDISEHLKQYNWPVASAIQVKPKSLKKIFVVDSVPNNQPKQNVQQNIIIPYTVHSTSTKNIKRNSQSKNHLKILVKNTMFQIDQRIQNEEKINQSIRSPTINVRLKLYKQEQLYKTSGNI